MILADKIIALRVFGGGQRLFKTEARGSQTLCPGYFSICIVGAIPLLLAMAFRASDLAGALCIDFLLLLVAVAVYLFVWSSLEWGACQMLLQEGDYTSEKKAEARSPLPAVYWCLITAAYLGISFYTDAWHRTWIIWPCAGVLFVSVQGIASIIRQNQKKEL